MKKRIIALLMVLSIGLVFMPAYAFAAPASGTVDSKKAVQKKKKAGITAAQSEGGMNKSSNCLPGGVFDLVTLDDVADDQPTADSPDGKMRAGNDSAKTMPLLMIVIGFNDTSYNEDSDWGSTIFSDKSEDWSLSKYYIDNSQGQFTFTPALETSAYKVDGNTNMHDAVNDGIVHVSVDMDHGNWVSVFRSDEERLDLRTWREALSGAMTKADEYVDFEKYDADGDGEIETNEMALGFIVAGGEASYTENSECSPGNYLTWAHAWEMTSFMDDAPECDGKSINKYIALGENIKYFRGGSDYSEDFDPFSEEWDSLADDISLGDTYSVDTSEKDGLFRFIPERSGKYCFYSEPLPVTDEESDPVGRVLNSTGGVIASNDDGEESWQFKVYFDAKAGKTYYLQATSSGETSFSVGVMYDDGQAPEEDFSASQAGIATLAHELGHYLGLPDYYNTDDESSGAWEDYYVGHISIMALGNWCYLYDESSENVTYRPCAFDACSRVALGWTEPVEADAGDDYTISSQDYTDNSGYTVVKIPTENEKEYYLVENRQFTGWDEALKTRYPKDDDVYHYVPDEDDPDDEEEWDLEESGSYADTGGLVFWHVDDGIIDKYQPENEINTSAHRPGYMPTYIEYEAFREGQFEGLSFIGDNVDTNKLFFDQEIYENNYQDAIGDKIVLPVYSTEEDTPAARTLGTPGITLSGTGNSITVRLSDSHTHDLKKTEATEPTCETAGNNAYWTCTKCKKVFSDEEGTTVTSIEEQTLAPIGHKYQVSSWEWTGNDMDGYTAAKLNLICANNAEHTKTVNAIVTSETYRPSCQETGVTTYTATAVYDGRSYVDTKTINVEAGSHSWGEIKYTWSEGNLTCTASRTCSKCGTTQSEQADRVEVTAQEASTCVANGWTEYTATFTDPDLGSTTTRAVKPKLGHNYGGWTVKSEPTEITSGTQIHRCSFCGKTETRSIAQLAPTLPVVKISKPKAAKKSATIKWKKPSKKNLKRIKKIEIQYSTDSNFNTGIKSKFVKAKKTSVKIKGLAKGQRYFVRIRANNGGHVSAWSRVMSVKAK